jgi:hypothetical protein
MSLKELNFAYKVRHALNESADNLPASTIERLSSARKIALSRKKPESRLLAFVPRLAVAGQAGRMFGAPSAWLGRMGLAIPMVVVAIGLASIYQTEQQRRITDLADIDAAVLSDDLPLSAYLDHGFNGYLANRGE